MKRSPFKQLSVFFLAMITISFLSGCSENDDPVPEIPVFFGPSEIINRSEKVIVSEDENAQRTLEWILYIQSQIDTNRDELFIEPVSAQPGTHLTSEHVVLEPDVVHNFITEIICRRSGTKSNGQQCYDYIQIVEKGEMQYFEYFSTDSHGGVVDPYLLLYAEQRADLSEGLWIYEDPIDFCEDGMIRWINTAYKLEFEYLPIDTYHCGGINNLVFDKVNGGGRYYFNDGLEKFESEWFADGSGQWKWTGLLGEVLTGSWD